MPFSNQGKKAQKLSSQQHVPAKQSGPHSRGKQPLLAPPEEPTQANPAGKKPQQPPLEHSTQEMPGAAWAHPQQPKQAELKGKQPQKSSSQNATTEQSLQSTFKGKPSMPPPPIPLMHYDDRTRKQADEPYPKQPVQEKTKDKQTKQPLQANTKGKQPEQPRPEQSVQADRRRKQVEQAVIESILQSKQAQAISIEQLKDPTAEGKQPETVSFTQRPPLKFGQQPSPYQFGRIGPQGKHIEQPGQANLTIQSEQPSPYQFGQIERKGKRIEQSRQADLSLQRKLLRQALAGKPKHPTAKDQPSQETSLKEHQQGKPQHRAILQNARPVYLGCPKVYITCIPCSKNGEPKSMKRVKVSVIPSGGRHVQTFFFKNIPDVESYWGFLNDEATSAQRIVRLEKEGEPMPYFLLACRGEWPEIKSPRNDNAIFAGLYEPMVFNDAFVFKLGEPEAYEDGYVNYVHIEEDLGSVGWIPQAIGEAAMRVGLATFLEANPGFPDMENYADPGTISEDARKTLKHIDAYRKIAAEKGDSAVPPEYELGMLEGGAMKDTIRNMIALLYVVRKDVFPPIDGGRKSSDDPEDPGCIDEANAAFKAIRDHDNNIKATQSADDAPSASTAAADKVIATLLREMEGIYYDLINRVQDVNEMMDENEKRSVISETMGVVFRHFNALQTKLIDGLQNGEVARKMDAARIENTVRGSGASSELPIPPGLPDIFYFRGGGLG